MRGTVRLAAILALVLFPNLISAQTATPAIVPGGILNAAGVASEPSNAAAPGGLVTIFGRNLANTTATGSGVPLPRELNGTAVLVGNVFAPLLFISPTQINAQIPLEVLPGSTVNVVVWVSGRQSAPEPLRVEMLAGLVGVGDDPGEFNPVDRIRRRSSRNSREQGIETPAERSSRAGLSGRLDGGNWKVFHEAGPPLGSISRNVSFR